jgi:hypothetical protein
MVRGFSIASKLALAAVAFIGATGSTTMPMNDRVVTYFDEYGGTAGVYVYNCLRQSSMMGVRTTNTFVVETACSEDRTPCDSYPEIFEEVFGPCPFA